MYYNLRYEISGLQQPPCCSGVGVFSASIGYGSVDLDDHKNIDLSIEIVSLQSAEPEIQKLPVYNGRHVTSGIGVGRRTSVMIALAWAIQHIEALQLGLCLEPQIRELPVTAAAILFPLLMYVGQYHVCLAVLGDSELCLYHMP